MVERSTGFPSIAVQVKYVTMCLLRVTPRQQKPQESHAAVCCGRLQHSAPGEAAKRVK